MRSRLPALALLGVVAAVSTGVAPALAAPPVVTECPWDLTWDEGDACVDVLVLDAFGDPLPTAQVSMSTPGYGYGFGADGSGHAQQTPVPGEYRISASAPGHGTTWFDGKQSEETADTWTLEAGQLYEFTIQLQLESTISGVVEAHDGTPLEDATVVVVDHRDWLVDDAQTDASGAYTVGGLNPGEYRAYAYPDWDENFIPEWFDAASDFDSATPIEIVAADHHVTDIDFALEEGGTISGDVVNSLGNPVADLSIDAEAGESDFGGWGYSEADGGFDVLGLPTGEYDLEVDDFFFTSATQSVAVTQGESVTGVRLEVQPRVPEEEDIDREIEPLSGPLEVVAGDTVEWTVPSNDDDGDVYAMLFSDPVYLGAGESSGDSATLELTIPADTEPGTHRLVFMQRSTFDNSYAHFEIEVTAPELAATGAEPGAPLAIALLALVAGAATLHVHRIANGAAPARAR